MAAASLWSWTQTHILTPWGVASDSPALVPLHCHLCHPHPVPRVGLPRKVCFWAPLCPTPSSF